MLLRSKYKNTKQSEYLTNFLNNIPKIKDNNNNNNNNNNNIRENNKVFQNSLNLLIFLQFISPRK
jgi:hypothetical protein